MHLRRHRHFINCNILVINFSSILTVVTTGGYKLSNYKKNAVFIYIIPYITPNLVFELIYL